MTKKLLKQLSTILSYAVALIFIGMCLGVGFMEGSLLAVKMLVSWMISVYWLSITVTAPTMTRSLTSCSILY